MSEVVNLEVLNANVAELRAKYHQINQVLVLSDREYEKQNFAKDIKSEDMKISDKVPADNPFRTGYTYVQLEQMLLDIAGELSELCVKRRQVSSQLEADSNEYDAKSDEEVVAMEAAATEAFMAARTDMRKLRKELIKRKAMAAAKEEVENMSPQKLKAILKHAHTIGVGGVDSGEKVDGLAK
jgi:hypothetical protein